MRRFTAVLLLGVLGCAGEMVDSSGARGPAGKADGADLVAADWRGHQRALVLLLDWTNVDSPVTREQVNDAFFSEAPGDHSIRQFFLENSAGSFDLSGDVLDWRETSKTWTAEAGCDLGSIVDAAWEEFGADVDVSSYDADSDDKIDNLFVIHSGRIAFDRVGPPCTFVDFSHANRTTVFQSQGTGSIGDALATGFYIHEAGHHYYSLPDLYANHYHGQYGIAMWGMMGLGAWGTSNAIARSELFRVPAHFEPYSKVRIGWVSPRVITSTQTSVVLRPIEQSNDIVAVPIGIGLAYYLEYRSRAGFSTGHRGHGLLIWKNYELVQADGRDDLNHGNDLGERPLPPIDENFGDATDPFPGDDHVTIYTDATTGVTFKNIVQHADRIELDVVVNGITPPFDLGPSLETFDGVERL